MKNLAVKLMLAGVLSHAFIGSASAVGCDPNGGGVKGGACTPPTEVPEPGTAYLFLAAAGVAAAVAKFRKKD